MNPYRAIDQYGQVIDVLSPVIRRPADFIRGPSTARWGNHRPGTDYLRVIEELIPAPCHVTEQYASNPSKPIKGA